MKKIKFTVILLLNIMLVLIGCSSNQTVKLDNDTKTTDETGIKQEQEKDTTPQVDEKLEEYQSIKEYLMNHDYFGMGYYEAEGDWYNDDNYILHHIDFTGDDKLDTIIVTYTNEEDFRTVVFVTLEDGKYKHYYTDFRATKDSTFYYEDGFIVQKRNGYHELAYLDISGDREYIERTFGGFYNGTEESDYTYNSNMKDKFIHTVNKIDGYKVFETENKHYYYDENHKEHLVSHIKYHNELNKDTLEFDSEEEIIVENNLDEIMANNFIIGTNDSLKTFNEVIEDKDNVKDAIDYYIENRQQYGRESRIKYIQDTFDYISKITGNIAFVDEEKVENDNISKITIQGDNPIPSEAEDIFKITRIFYIEDGLAFDMNMEIELEDNNYEGDYVITCVDNKYTNKIRTMKFDMDILVSDDEEYSLADYEYVDIVFDTKENVHMKADKITYPTILINKLSQLNELKHKSIWKTKVIMIPQEVEFLGYVQEDI
ncbi:MAG: hypothetical protein N4A50_15095 [Vallitalea sp.]|jgi:hypothetical protein|nr:hypothetical protein [Vallitalea sp.]